MVFQAQAEPKNFELLYRKYADDVFNYIWYRVNHDRQTAEDLMQETFFRAFKHLAQFKDFGYSYRTYLFTIAKNLLINYSKKKTPLSLEELTEIPAEVTHNQQADRKIAAENLWQAVQNLSNNERDAILMYYRKEMPVKDIAAIMEKTPNAVKIILTRGRKKLKNHPYLKDIINFTDAPRQYVKPKFLTNLK